VVGVLGMNVEDGPEILIDAGRRWRGGAGFHPFDTLRVDSGEVGSVKTLQGSSGEEQSGESKEGEDTHIFILRGYLGSAHGGMMVMRISRGNLIMAADVSSEKRQLHELIDRLPPERSGAFLRALNSLSADPVLLSLLNSPPDDEPYTEQQRNEDARAEESIARGEGIRHEDLLHEFGL
jgi:hypothetical protein